MNEEIAQPTKGALLTALILNKSEKEQTAEFNY